MINTATTTVMTLATAFLCVIHSFNDVIIIKKSMKRVRERKKKSFHSFQQYIFCLFACLAFTTAHYQRLDITSATLIMRIPISKRNHKHFYHPHPPIIAEMLADECETSLYE